MSDNILSAIIATATTLAVTFIKDVIVEGGRKRRQARMDLLDRKLKDLYVPMFVALGGGTYPLSYILRDDRSYAKLSENYHLLSADLRRIIEASMRLSTGPNHRDPGLRTSDFDEYRRLNEEFDPILRREIDELRKEYLKYSESWVTRALEFVREQMQQS
jgi:hypothetical protein